MENKLKNCPTKHQDYENCKKENTRLKSIIQSQYDELREVCNNNYGDCSRLVTQENKAKYIFFNFFYLHF